ncbi:unannotated protein [freshwater metagenome]|uniref:site-specific DNA-methyltransferase (adenine-specific) n=1 Tax=freshwater metagenome TaxID=449393 RepID=A0A6J7JY84_9ZZZZ|nr:BREX-2 system adenine-specific DNA-methyltransferase PglX [Actinomycetota bacterium]
MIDARTLTADLKRLVTELEDDIRHQAGEDPETDERLHEEHEAARAADRTAASFEEWRDGEVTQAAVGWVLSTVFVRFLEDNHLIDDPLVGGIGDRLAAAKGRRDVYFDQHPSHSDRDHLQWCFHQVAAFPAAAALFDESHAAVWRLSPSADGAKAVREFFLRPDPQTGELVHDFTDHTHDTRFLGDLYQDLSDAAKKRYALLQTPGFVEEFILDRTLTPAIAEFGLTTVRLIDPTCGSGHFLIGALRRMFVARQDREPGTRPEQLVRTILEQQVFGVDLNPYATAVARFRLVIEALGLAGVGRLADAPPIALNLATGDSLLHGPVSAVGRDGNLAGQLFEADVYRLGIEHAYATEDAAALGRILGQGYHAVVGNPPYIAVQDEKLRDAYRARYRFCRGQYVLTVPFMERFFELARIVDEETGRASAGFVGKITGNNFMKREFGKPLVEEFLSGRDKQTPAEINAVIDASGAFIPGHGTPTVILFGRTRRPTSPTLRVLDGVRGEPSQPTEPARGEVWSSIVDLVDKPGVGNQFVRASDIERLSLLSHLMMLGIGRGLKNRLGEFSESTVKDHATELGFTAATRLDPAFFVAPHTSRTLGLNSGALPAVEGDIVRDWLVSVGDDLAFPYNDELEPACERGSPVWRLLWRNRQALRMRLDFGGTMDDRGMPWFAYSRFVKHRHGTPSITWGEVAAHNHFVLDRGGKVFNRTAPVIKLPESASESEHLALLGVLNSSVVAFWLKQVCQPKGAHLAQSRTREERYAFNGSNVADVPLPAHRSPVISAELDRLARERHALLEDLAALPSNAVLVDELAGRQARETALTARMIFLQEELDWQVLRAFGLVPDDLPLAFGDDRSLDLPAPFGIALGHRSFEVVLARQVQAGETQTTWFERHSSTPVVELPATWPDPYRDLVARRITLMNNDPDVAMIEAPEHKRRWSREAWDKRERRALESLILDRLEDPSVWGDVPRLRAATELTDVVRADELLAQAVARIAGRPDADRGAVVAELLVDSSVPFLAALRLKDPGLRKHAVWERVWEKQRYEDRIDVEVAAAGLSPDEAERRKAIEVGRIDVPPKYGIGDFRHPRFWSQRGKLDVPKERFLHVPGAERGADTSPVFGWAGWNERDRAVALAGRIYELREQEAADAERLTPLLAGIDELLPWIAQWFPDDDPDYGGSPADYFEGWLDQQLAELGLTRAELRGWRPAAATRGRRAST